MLFRSGVLVLLTDVQETVDSLISVRDRMVFIFLLALAVVLVLAGLIFRLVNKPVAELSGGIEGGSKGGYEYRAHGRSGEGRGGERGKSPGAAWHLKKKINSNWIL